MVHPCAQRGVVLCLCLLLTLPGDALLAGSPEPTETVPAVSAEAGAPSQSDRSHVLLSKPPQSLPEIPIETRSLTVAGLYNSNTSPSALRADPAIVSATQRLTVRPQLGQAEESKAIGTGAHGKMTFGEKLSTFRIGRLSHSASVAVMVLMIGGAAAASIAVPLTVGK